MNLVIDPSALLALALEDEAADYAEQVLAAVVEHSARVPTLFYFEVRNVLVVNEWRGRIAPESTDAFLSALQDLPIEVAPLPSDLSLMELARKHRLTAYDAAYLELARSSGSVLATLDREIRASAEAVGVEIFEAGPE